MWREEGVMVGVRQKEQLVPFNKEVENAEGWLHGCCPSPLNHFLTGKAGCEEPVSPSSVGARSRKMEYSENQLQALSKRIRFWLRQRDFKEQMQAFVFLGLLMFHRLVLGMRKSQFKALQKLKPKLKPGLCTKACLRTECSASRLQAAHPCQHATHTHT